MTLSPRYLVAVVAVTLAAFIEAGCPSAETRSEAIDPSTLPQDVRPDYEVFAQRCSKCHSLARPLNSGIVDDDYWAMYVARMRRQPSSGISVEDSRVILRFLHFYSLEQIRKKQAHSPRTGSDSAAPALSSGSGDGAVDAGAATKGAGDAG